MVGMQGCNNPTRWIIKHCRTFPMNRIELEVNFCGEKRLKLPDRFAFVIKDNPTGPDPAIWLVSAVYQPSFSLDLALDLTTEAIRIAVRFMPECAWIAVLFT